MSTIPLMAMLNIADLVVGTELASYDGNDEDAARRFHVVLYHSHCADGFGAAWAIHRAALQGLLGRSDVLYVPISYGNRDTVVGDLARELDGHKVEIHIVDFSIPVELFRSLMTVAQEVTYLDHHQGAADELENARGVCREKAIPAYIKFDNEHSGCVLAWEHYITEATCEPVPPVLACVEDRDLWRFRMPETKAVCANVYSYPMTMSAWDQIAARPFEDVADGGIDILRAHDKNVEQLTKDHNVSYYRFNGLRVAVVNCPWFVVSDVCNLLLTNQADIDIAAGFHVPQYGRAKWSFRARKGGIDLPTLLKQYGGGGHQAAAGVEFNDLMSDEAQAFYGAMHHEQ